MVIHLFTTNVIKTTNFALNAVFKETEEEHPIWLVTQSLSTKVALNKNGQRPN